MADATDHRDDAGDPVLDEIRAGMATTGDGQGRALAAITTAQERLDAAKEDYTAAVVGRERALALAAELGLRAADMATTLSISVTAVNNAIRRHHARETDAGDDTATD